jgi:hypothetical protein
MLLPAMILYYGAMVANMVVKNRVAFPLLFARRPLSWTFLKPIYRWYRAVAPAEKRQLRRKLIAKVLAPKNLSISQAL